MVVDHNQVRLPEPVAHGPVMALFEMAARLLLAQVLFPVYIFPHIVGYVKLRVLAQAARFPDKFKHLVCRGRAGKKGTL